VEVRTHRRRTRAQLVRLQGLQDSLDVLMFEARQLRARIDLIIAAQRFATRVILATANKHRRLEDLSRANRVF
jgi:hypothetical protein